uniref:Uncharacterized protein n=1 Tax=Anguilla anguilla TaxID=7936 RepID=A0A0E9QAT5_ANGAN
MSLIPLITAPHNPRPVHPIQVQEPASNGLDSNCTMT